MALMSAAAHVSPVLEHTQSRMLSPAIRGTLRLLSSRSKQAAWAVRETMAPTACCLRMQPA